MNSLIFGRAWVFGDNIDTDVILPGQYLKLSGDDLKAHVMEGVDPTFANKVRPGDILVGGRNFGCGSSRETAPGVLKDVGITAIIAPFFARIFYRNAINLGLPVIECPQLMDIHEGDELSIDFQTGRIVNQTQASESQFRAFPDHVMNILDAGGLVAYLRKRLAGRVG